MHGLKKVHALFFFNKNYTTYMRKLLLFFIISFILGAFQLIAQNSIDSLKAVLQEPSTSNRLKVDIYNELAWQLRRINPDAAYNYADSAEILATEISYLKGLGDAFQRKGSYYKIINAYSLAFLYFRDALEERHKTGDSLAIAASYNSLGGICRSLGDYNQAAKYIYESLMIREQLGDTSKIYNTTRALLNLYSDIQDSIKVVEYFTKAKKYVPKSQKPFLFLEYAAININNGWATDTVKLYLQKAKTHGIDDTYLKEKVPLIEIQVLIKEAKLLEALTRVQTYLAQGSSLKTEAYVQSAYESLADIYERLGDFNKALIATDSAILYARSSGAVSSEIKQFFHLSKIYGKMGIYDSAYFMLLKHSNGIDTIANSDLVSKFENKYIQEREEAKQERNELEKDKAEAQKNVYLVLFISAIIIAIAIFFILQQRAKNLKALNEKNQELMASKEKEHNNRIEQVLTEKEVEMLEAVMNGMEKERTRIGQDLHDELGSILATTRLHFASMEDQIDQLNDTQQQQYKKGIALIDQACDEMRNISHNMMSGLLQEYGLVIAIKDLAQSINDAGMITVNVIDSNLETRLPQETEVVIYRIIQELLSNILKHAQASEVTIQINRYNGDLGITVEDDGKGFDYHVSRQGNGMGLRNIERRVSALGGTWHIETSPGRGTLSNITVHI